MKFTALALALASFAAQAAKEPAKDPFPLGPKTLYYGVGLRVGGGYATSSPTDGLGISTLDVRPYISGSIAPWLNFTGNLDLNNGDAGRIHVLDAIAQFGPDDLFHVWMGRFLPPSDRANLSGPYYQNAWNYPAMVNGYPSIYAGRADGAAVWGQVNKGQFKYQAGIFTIDPTPVLFSQAIYAARLVYNVFDPEPGYYNSSTYYGAKNLLAIGGAIQYKKTPDPVTGEKKLVGFNFDLLFERHVLTDVLTLEGAYYNFDQGTGNGPGGKQGWSFFALASWLFMTKVGPGRFQPMVRYQHFVPTLPSGGDATFKTFDGGLNYILDGHNARVALVVQNIAPPGTASNQTSFQLGIQIQE